MSKALLRRGLFLALAVLLGAVAILSVGVGLAMALDGYAPAHVAAMVAAIALVLAFAVLTAWLARRSWRAVKTPGDPATDGLHPGKSAQQLGKVGDPRAALYVVGCGCIFLGLTVAGLILRRDGDLALGYVATAAGVVGLFGLSLWIKRHSFRTPS